MSDNNNYYRFLLFISYFELKSVLELAIIKMSNLHFAKSK